MINRLGICNGRDELISPLSQRFNEMVVELNRSRNLLGFVQAVGGEGSGLALFAAAIQFTLDRIPGRSERKAEA